MPTSKNLTPKTGKTGVTCDPNPPGNSGTWDDKDRPEVAAHEAGHLLGKKDTYKQDPKTKKSVPKAPKYNNDIMATTKVGAKPLQEHIDQIIKSSGRTAPPKPKDVPPPKPKNQSMEFVVPFSLAELTIPGSVTFELYPESMISHSLSLELPDYLGGGTVSLDFQYGYGEIFFNHTQDPDTIVFYLRSWVMVYSEFEIQGRYTGPNTGTTDPWSHGFLDISTSDLIIYEVGVYTNNIYPSTNPVWWDITYSGHANFTTNVIYLNGSGTVHFPLLPVGGVWVPVDKFGLLAPYIALASTILVATAATAIYVKRVKHREEKR